MKTKKIAVALVALVLGAGAVGCETNAGNGALIGGAGGALAGAAIGSHSHSRAGAGALVGGAVGAIGGAIVGNEIDKQQQGPGYGSYDHGGYARGGYEDDGYVYERPVYRRTTYYYEDCPPPRYRYHRYHGYWRGGRYYSSAYYARD